MSRNTLRYIVFCLFIGLAERLLTICFLYDRFNVNEVLAAITFGSAVDLVTFCTLGIILSGVELISTRAKYVTFMSAIILFTVLNSLDVFSLTYTFSRLSLVSLNVFSPVEISDKLYFSHVVKFLFYIFPIIILLIVFRKSMRIEWRTKASSLVGRVCLFSVLSMVWLPFPLSYYATRLIISSDVRQVSFNPFYTWSSSLLYRNARYQMDPQAALSAYKRICSEDGNDNFPDRVVNYRGGGYKRTILVMMESFGANRVGVLGGRKDLSPNFDALCREGVLYTSCFACGPRTQFAVSSILYGFPNILGYNLFRQNKLRLPFHGVHSALECMGVSSTFIHGGSADYDDMKQLLRAEIDVRVMDQGNIKNAEQRTSWGVDDASLFAYSDSIIQNDTGKRFYSILTMTNHDPHLAPFFPNRKKQLSAAEQTFQYSDFALGQFVRRLKSNHLYDSSLIIITGDHGERYDRADGETKLFHVPLLIIDHRNVGTNANVCSHSDIAEYIIAQWGYKGQTHLTKSTLLGERQPVAYYRDYDDNVYRVRKDTVYQYNLDSSRLLELLCDSSYYVISRRVVAADERTYPTIKNEIIAVVTANKYLYESGLYKRSYRCGSSSNEQ